MATAATPARKILLTAVGAVLGSALAVGGFTTLAGPAEASSTTPVGVSTPLGAKQGLTAAGLPVADGEAAGSLPCAACTAPLSAPATGSAPDGDPAGPSQHDGLPQDPPVHVDPIDPGRPYMPIPGTDPDPPKPGDPLYDPPFQTQPEIGPGHPLYDPPFHSEPVVRDHRDDAPGWGTPTGADAPGGTTVTPTDGGPVIRDHRK